jgi:hypothetical protein
MMDLVNHHVKSLVILLGFGLFCLLVRLVYLWQFDGLLGWDTMYYFVQIKALSTEGKMHSPEPALIYPLQYALLYLCQGSYQKMFYVNIALTASGITTASMFYAFLRTRQWPIAFMIGLISLSSTELWWFCIQYPKNALGMLCLLLLISLSLRRHTYVTATLGLFLCVLAFFSHALIFYLSLFWLAIRGFLTIQPSANLSAHSAPKYRTLLIGVAVVFAVGALVVAKQQGYFVRFEGTLTSQLTLTQWAFVQQIRVENGSMSPFWLIELCSIVPVLAALLFYLLRSSQQKAQGLALLVFCALLLFPLLEFDSQSLSYRLLPIAILLVPLVVAELYYLVGRQLKGAISWILSGLLAIGILSWCFFKPQTLGPNRAEFEYISKAISQDITDADSSTLIIAPKAWAEAITFYSGIDAMPWLVEYPVPDRHLWRVTSGLHPGLVKQHCSDAQSEQLIDLGIKSLLLMPESIWQESIKNAQSQQDTAYLRVALAGMNPYQLRPEWLLRRKK